MVLLTDCPRPGDTFTGGRTVVASGEDDDGYGLLLLNAKPPYYSIVRHHFDGREEGLAWHRNIVPAAAQFHETFNFWGGS